LYRLNVYAAGASIKDGDAENCVDAVNEILSDWNAERQAVYVDRFDTFTTTPALQPHTIGPTGVWAMAQRPVSIEAATWLSAGAVAGRITIHRDPLWWDAQSSAAGSLSADAYYAPEMPNGKLYFVGIPVGAASVRLLTRSQFAPVVITDSLELPQGYPSALTLTLMETVAEDFGKDVSAKLERDAGKARGRIFANNLHVPSLSASGQGLPGLSGGRWDARTGQWC